MKSLRLVYALAILLSCSAPATSPSATPIATLAASASPSASPTAPVVLRDLSVVAAGEPRGDHALVLVLDNDGGPHGGGANRVWDVPLDGSTPRSIVAYTRAERALSGYFGVSTSRGRSHPMVGSSCSRIPSMSRAKGSWSST